MAVGLGDILDEEDFARRGNPSRHSVADPDSRSIEDVRRNPPRRRQV
jgi:hypothetical protein